MKKTTVIIIIIMLFAMSTKAQTSMNTLNPSKNGRIPFKVIDCMHNFILDNDIVQHKDDSLLIEFNKLKNFANSCIDLLNDMPAYYKENSCYWGNFTTQIELMGLKSREVIPKFYEPCEIK